ncbi:alpha/beta fold hydrolase [Bradyrhizobium sp. RP6]|uniref:alpha/beta fold hydrolase n=1 Tax=Bradyrhizobium sp. RP6 TaxID=2489596 RepID=UPI000F52C685|nr:alpha/beta fold hydrolase [Bradyrhizobium sp. RP6]RQH15027.1 alpha/beta fold hydrolase [Bradyrhizobium sp. RP6]
MSVRTLQPAVDGSVGERNVHDMKARRMNVTRSEVREHLLGVWTLVEWSEQQPGKSKAYPLGEHAIGKIIYTADGHVSAQLARRGRRSFPSGDWRDADKDDAAHAFLSYFGYFGTFSIDTDRHVITHRVEGSWYPNLERDDQQHHYRFENGLLVLDAETERGTVRIVWRRAAAAREKTRIVESVRIAEQADTLARGIGAFSAVGEWHPMLTKVTSEGERNGSRRIAEARDGSRQTERLLEVAPDHRGYRYLIDETAMPVRDYVAEFRIIDDRDGASTVQWSVQFELTMHDAMTAEGIRTFIKTGLDSIATRYGRAAAKARKETTRLRRSQSTCRTNELEVAYEVCGPADGRPLVLVHGWPDDVRCWDKVIDRLSGRNFRIYAPYLRGSGPTRFLRSSTMRSGAIAALTLDLSQFIDVLDLNDVVLGGYDWGARAAYGVAALFPHRLAGVVAAAAGYATAIPASRMPHDLARAYWYEWYAATSNGRTAYRDDRKRLCRYLWQSWSPAWPDRDVEFEAAASSLDNPDWADISLHAYRQRWRDAEGAPDHEDVERRLAEPPTINVPTIMLQGAEDGDDLPVTSEHKERYFGSSYERRLLPGIGHFVPREAPDRFAAAILDIPK